MEAPHALIDTPSPNFQRMPDGVLEKFRQGRPLWSVTNDCILRVSGRDHLRYLHGRLTQDVRGAEIGVPYQTLLLSSNGRFQGSFTLLRRDDEVVLIGWGDRERSGQINTDLLQFKVADSIDVSIQSSSRFSIWNPIDGDLILDPDADSSGVFTFDESILDGRIRHLFVPIERAQEVQSQLSSEVLSPTEADATELLCRIARFHVRLGIDVREQTIGAELPPERFVSFTKGCYAGQETIEMATARGKSPRLLGIYQVVGVDEDNFSEFASLTAHEKVVGEFSSAIFVPDTHSLFGFARVRSDASVDGALAVSDGRKVYPAHLVSHFVLP